MKFLLYAAFISCALFSMDEWIDSTEELYDILDLEPPNHSLLYHHMSNCPVTFVFADGSEEESNQFHLYSLAKRFGALRRYYGPEQMPEENPRIKMPGTPEELDHLIPLFYSPDQEQPKTLSSKIIICNGARNWGYTYIEQQTREQVASILKHLYGKIFEKMEESSHQHRRINKLLDPLNIESKKKIIADLCQLEENTYHSLSLPNNYTEYMALNLEQILTIHETLTNKKVKNKKRFDNIPQVIQNSILQRIQKKSEILE